MTIETRPTELARVAQRQRDWAINDILQPDIEPIQYAVVATSGDVAVASVLPAVVIGHGQPDGANRIRSHLAVPLTWPTATHDAVPCYTVAAAIASGAVSSEQSPTASTFVSGDITVDTGTYDGRWVRFTSGPLQDQTREIATHVLVKPDPEDEETWYAQFTLVSAFGQAPLVGNAFSLHPNPSIEFSSLEPGGWFHTGQVVTLFKLANGLYKAHCASFCGVVTKVGREAGDPAKPLCVEVAPYDGDPAIDPSDLTLSGSPPPLRLYDGAAGRADGRLYQAALFAGSSLKHGERVLVTYVGQVDTADPPTRTGYWLAWRGLNIEGDRESPVFASGPPPEEYMSEVYGANEPGIPADVPADDALTDPDYIVWEEEGS